MKGKHMGDDTDKGSGLIMIFRHVGETLPDGWTVGPDSPKTGKPTDFMIFCNEANWDVAMLIAAQMEKRIHRNAHAMTDDEAEALSQVIREEKEYGQDMPLKEIFKGKICWSSAVLPDTPDMARSHYITDGETDIQFKKSPASIVVFRDAEITPP
jgi:hypothetical protein